jgi:hypothetical protein
VTKVYFQVLLLLALNAGPVPVSGSEQEAGHQAASKKACSGSDCTTTIEAVNPPAPRPPKAKKYRDWVSGRALFVFALVNAALSITAEAGGFYPWIGPGVYPMALLWVALMQVSVHMAIKQLRKLGGETDRNLKSLVNRGWGLIVVGGLAWIVNIGLFAAGASQAMTGFDETDRREHQQVFELYMIELYAVAVPVAIAAFAFSIGARVAAARMVKTFPGTNPEEVEKRSKVTFCPYAWPAGRGFIAGMGGIF